ncbi:MAG TPA: endonuclease/exonuclease/phosphatase family protein [Gemmatimonadales bacterium]
MILVATFNLYLATRLERAIEVAASEPALAGADVLALQEADETAAHRMADALRLGYVYYPALVHPRTRRNFGPALLSRWPIVDDRRLELPHIGLTGMPRIAVAATLQLRDQPVSVYVVHFGTMREILPNQQKAQAQRVLADAAARPGPAIIAGDLNRKSLGALFQSAGWRWVTREVGRTHLVWSFDHVFLRGFDGARVRAGSVRAALAASDHRAVWAEVG